MRIEEIVGSNIRRAREAREPRMTQDALGKALEDFLGRSWSRQAVSIAEKGGRDFTAAELLALAVVLGQTVGYFFTPFRPDQEDVALPSGRTIPADNVLLLFTSHPLERLDSIGTTVSDARRLLNEAISYLESIEVQSGVRARTFERIRKGLEDEGKERTIEKPSARPRRR